MNSSLRCQFVAGLLLALFASTAFSQQKETVPRSFSIVRGSGKWDVSGLTWSPDGKQLAIPVVRSFEKFDGTLVSENYSVQIWNTIRLRPRATARATIQSGIPLQHMVFSPDGALLALNVNAKGVNEGVPIWRTRGGKLVKVLKLWGQPLAFRSKGQIIAVDNDTINFGGSKEFGLEFRDVKRDQVQRRMKLQLPTNRYSAYARASSGGGGFPVCLLSPDVQRGALMLWKPTRSPGNTSGAETLLFDPRTGKPGQLLRVAPNENFEPVAFSHDGRMLGMIEIWEDNGARAKVFDCTTGRLISTLAAPSRKNSIIALSLSRNGSIAAIATAHGLVQLRESKSGKLIRTLQDGPKESVVALAFSPDGRTLAVGERNGAVRLWLLRKP